jgi:hypothetical protein
MAYLVGNTPANVGPIMLIMFLFKLRHHPRLSRNFFLGLYSGPARPVENSRLIQENCKPIKVLVRGGLAMNTAVAR